MEIFLFFLSLAMEDYTKRGVQIPLPDGIDLVEDVVEYHNVSYDEFCLSIQISLHVNLLSLLTSPL